MGDQARYFGRSGQLWTVQPILLRPGYLRPTSAGNEHPAPHRVDLVHNEDEDNYGALRQFADRRERATAIKLIAAAAPVTPALLDVIDDPALPPAIVTSWAAGGSDVLLSRLHEADDLAYLLESGRRWEPAEALRALVPLGQALDTLAEHGFVPLELSPDHLIYNSGSIRLVGISRHRYRPDVPEMPDPSGMSLPAALLLGDDMPALAAGAGVWRATQTRVLLRLAGWMACGLPPAAWGPVAATTDLERYLKFAGFADTPRISPGRLADSLAATADQQEQRAVEQRLREASAILLYDNEECAVRGVESNYEWLRGYESEWLTATVREVDGGLVKARIDVPGGNSWSTTVRWQGTPQGSRRRHGHVDLREHYSVGDRVTVQVREVLRPDDGKRWPQTRVTIVDENGTWMRPRRRGLVRINAESVRLGLLLEHGPSVVAIAALDARGTGPRASLLSGAGWALVEPGQLGQLAKHLTRINPDARYVIAGRPSDAVASALGTVNPEVVLPSSAQAAPVVARRPATDLPYVDDPDLTEFGKRLPPRTGKSFQRRTFPAAWTHAWDAHESDPGAGSARVSAPKQWETLASLFAGNTELLIQVGTFLRRPGNLKEDPNRLRANLERAATVLGSVPAHGKFRRDLMKALLGTTYEDLYRLVTQRLLPVATELANAYDPNLTLGDQRMDESLFDQRGVRRLGLFGRLVTALPKRSNTELAGIVSELDDALVAALADIPAPSLQYLIGRLSSPQLLAHLSQLIASGDLDLLNRYTPAAWRLLLEGLRQVEFLNALGLGWALVVERDWSSDVDARVLLRLSAECRHEPRYIVRTLLDTPADSWPAVVAHPELATQWLDRFGTLDFAAVLAVYPDAEELAKGIGVGPLRAAAAAGIGRDQLRQLIDFAEAVDITAEDAFAAIVASGRDPSDIALLTTTAATAWIAKQLSKGQGLGSVIAEVIDKPSVLRIWAVTGRGLARRVLADVLGTRPNELAQLGVGPKDGRELIALLERQPGLVRLCDRVPVPRQRLGLLTLAAERPDGTLVHPLIIDALPDLLDQPNPGRTANIILDEGISLAQVVRADKLRLDRRGRRMLRLLGPLATSLSTTVVRTLLGLGHVNGPGFLLAAAQVEVQRPGTAQILEQWGPEWLPVLAGTRGRAVATVLAEHRAKDPRWTTEWLLMAGHNGMLTLAQHGDRFLAFLAEVSPPVGDVLLINELLSQPAPHAMLYRMVIGYGLPKQTWSLVAAWLSRDNQADDILLRLWDADAGRLTRIRE